MWQISEFRMLPVATASGIRRVGVGVGDPNWFEVPLAVSNEGVSPKRRGR